MAQILAILSLITTLLPMVVQMVDAVEKALPEKGQGAQKLEMVRSMLEAAVAASGNLGLAFAQVWPAVQGVVGAVVAARNATGAFRKS